MFDSTRRMNVLATIINHTNKLKRVSKQPCEKRNFGFRCSWIPANNIVTSTWKFVRNLFQKMQLIFELQLVKSPCIIFLHPYFHLSFRLIFVGTHFYFSVLFEYSGRRLETKEQENLWRYRRCYLRNLSLGKAELVFKFRVLWNVIKKFIFPFCFKKRQYVVNNITQQFAYVVLFGLERLIEGKMFITHYKFT